MLSAEAAALVAFRGRIITCKEVVFGGLGALFALSCVGVGGVVWRGRLWGRGVEGEGVEGFGFGRVSEVGNGNEASISGVGRLVVRKNLVDVRRAFIECFATGNKVVARSQ